MPLHQNNLILIETLTNTPLLAGRFEQIQVVNYNPKNGDKRGCLSLVFKAFDRKTNNFVALKFYDLDPKLAYNHYRISCFDREHEILQQLINVDRCLQLQSQMDSFDLEIDVPGGMKATIPCKYFAVEWIDHEIDAFFLANEDIDTEEKLLLFNSIVLAVEALHRHEVFHRDLKADNLREYRDALMRMVVAIDLGTAARWDSEPVVDVYQRPAGAPAYSAPESQCGMAGNRLVAKSTDIYALGCMLFEMFNRDYYCDAFFKENPNAGPIFLALSDKIRGIREEREQLQVWYDNINTLGASLRSPRVDGMGCSLPKGIAILIREVVESMTSLDLRKRPRLEWVRQRIWTTIHVIRNEVSYQKRLEFARARRERRVQKAKEKEALLHRIVGVAAE